ncbi:MAG: hypothetical protein KAW09_07210, partial [Thermoplasmata archaeon]|nr:hypothetical protein [Thermoplasmata archaeon]
PLDPPQHTSVSGSSGAFGSGAGWEPMTTEKELNEKRATISIAHRVLECPHMITPPFLQW